MKKIVFFLVVALAFLCLITAPAGAITLRFIPSSQTVGVGDSVDVALMISGLTAGAPDSLGAFDLDVTYDPAILGFTSYELGSFLGDVSLFEALDSSLSETTAGTVNLAEVSCLPVSELDALQLAFFTLATLTFDTLAVGTSDLNFQNVILGDAGGIEFTDITLESGSISPVPEPATLFLLGSGLIGLMGFHRKRRRA